MSLKHPFDAASTVSVIIHLKHIHLVLISDWTQSKSEYSCNSTFGLMYTRFEQPDASWFRDSGERGRCFRFIDKTSVLSLHNVAKFVTPIVKKARASPLAKYHLREIAAVVTMERY